MDLWQPIDQYCERTDASLLSEPLNLFSNTGFILAGLIIIKSLKSSPEKTQPPGAWFLASMILIIGFGSGLFHSFANTWSMWADVLPIAIFVFAYLWLFLRQRTHQFRAGALVTLTGFLVLSFFVAKLADHQTSNGSESYFGTWIALFGISCFYAGRGEPTNQRRMLLATLLFSLSILFRTMDEAFCYRWPLGTHVFWHLLNSLVLYLVTKAYISTQGRS